MSRTRSFNVHDEEEMALLPQRKNGSVGELSWVVEHLATFGYGKESGILTPTDGLNKLTQCELAGTVYPQRMVLRLTEDKVVVQEEATGDLIEEFLLQLVCHPFSYVSKDDDENHNKLFGFAINVDHSKNLSDSEMHVFQCLSHSPNDILELFEKTLETARKKQKQSETRPSAFKKENLKMAKSAKISDDDEPVKSKSSSMSSTQSLVSLIPTSSNGSPKESLSSDPAVLNVKVTEIPFIVNSRVSPTYTLEHLTTFKYGSKFGVSNIDSAIRKLVAVEKSHGLWVQKVIMRIDDDAIILKDADKKRIAKIPMDLVCNPYAYHSSNQNDIYNNLLIFVAKSEKEVHPNDSKMYIFQCGSYSAVDIVHQLNG